MRTLSQKRIEERGWRAQKVNEYSGEEDHNTHVGSNSTKNPQMTMNKTKQYYNDGTTQMKQTKK